MSTRFVLALPVLLLTSAAPAQPSLVGSDSVERRVCTLYEGYAVVTQDAPGELGETISVFRRDGEDASVCGAAPADALLTVGSPGEARYFVGLLGPTLFLDSGTGPEWRTLEVLDVEEGTTVWSGAYWGDTIDAGPDGRVTFLVPLTERPPGHECPEDEAYGWGGSYGFEERVWLDLRTGAVERTGELSCSYRQ